MTNTPKRFTLRTEQPHLWQRVLAISILLFLTGLPLLFAPTQTTPNANVSVMGELLHLRYHAFIFMFIGVALFVSSFYYKNNYYLTRMMLAICGGYMVMWLLSLLYGGLTGNLSGLAIVSYQGFITYIIINTLRDPGFTISDLIREVRLHHTGKEKVK